MEIGFSGDRRVPASDRGDSPSASSKEVDVPGGPSSFVTRMASRGSGAGNTYRHNLVKKNGLKESLSDEVTEVRLNEKRREFFRNQQG
jgi:hypothetical protein